MPPKISSAIKATPKKTEKAEPDPEYDITKDLLDGDSEDDSSLDDEEDVIEEIDPKEKKEKKEKTDDKKDEKKDDKKDDKKEKKTPNKKKDKQPLCKIQRNVFLKEAKDIKITVFDNAFIDGDTIDLGLTAKQGPDYLVAVPREFSTRSFGWGSSAVRKMKVGDKEVNVRISANIVVVGSKDTYYTRHAGDSENEPGAVSRKRKIEDAIDKDAAKLETKRKKPRKSETPAKPTETLIKTENKEPIKALEPIPLVTTTTTTTTTTAVDTVDNNTDPHVNTVDTVITNATDITETITETTTLHITPPTNMEVDDLEPPHQETPISNGTRQTSDIEMSQESIESLNASPLDTLSPASISSGSNGEKPATGVLASCIIL